MANLQECNFGIEIETIGKGREDMAILLSNYFGCGYKVISEDYRYKLDNGYICVYDGSLRDDNYSKTNTCEIVSPTLPYSEFKTICKMVVFLSKNGVSVNDSCGIHVHVSHNEMHNVKTLVNMLYMVNARYELLCKACVMSDTRMRKWNRKASKDMLAYISRTKPCTMVDLANIWYCQFSNYDDLSTYNFVFRDMDVWEINSHVDEKYDNTRYCLCNLHSYFQGKGVEIRAFNSSLNPCDIEAYVTLSCGMLAKAINDKAQSYKTRRNDSNIARQMVDFLWSCNIRGKNKDMKVTRDVLTKHFGLNPWEKKED